MPILWDVEMRLEALLGALERCFRRRLRRPKLVFGGLQRGASLIDRVEFQKRLNFLRSLRRLGQDELDDLSTRKGYFAVLREFSKHRGDVGVGRRNFGSLMPLNGPRDLAFLARCGM